MISTSPHKATFPDKKDQRPTAPKQYLNRTCPTGPTAPRSPANPCLGYFPTCPVSPAFCRALNASLSLKSPFTVKVLAPLVAVFPVTPGTSPSAVPTAFTHFPQHRCTPSISSDFTFSPLAPV